MTNIREKILEKVSNKILPERLNILAREKEIKMSIHKRLLNIPGVISIEEQLEKAKELMNVSTKNVYFFKKNNTDKVFALLGEELNDGTNTVVILKSIQNSDTKIINKKDLLENPNLIAVSTYNTTLKGIHLQSNSETSIDSLLENKSKVSQKNKIK